MPGVIFHPNSGLYPAGTYRGTESAGSSALPTAWQSQREQRGTETPTQQRRK